MTLDRNAVADRRTAARRALALVDLTDLNDGATEAAAEILCRRALQPVPSEPERHVAAVCLWPRFVSRARAALGGSSPVRVATVANFPSGGEAPDGVLRTVEGALADGADEIDLVIDYKGLAAGYEAGARAGVERVRAAVPHDKVLKVILETGELGSAVLIDEAAQVAVAAGADFLKTSTGKVPVNATAEAVRLLLEAARAAPRKVGVKASGGIRTLADAETYLGLADGIMGAEWASPATFRFGASGLLDALVAAIEGRNGAEAAKGY